MIQLFFHTTTLRIKQALTLLLFFWGTVASAKYINLNYAHHYEWSSSPAGQILVGKLKVSNLGNDMAKEVKPRIQLFSEVWEGDSRELLPSQESIWEYGLTFLPPENVVKGVVFLRLLVSYQSEVGGSYSSVSAFPVQFGEDTVGPSLEVRGGLVKNNDEKIHGEWPFFLEIQNNGSEKLNLKFSSLVPKEMSAEFDSTPRLSLAPRGLKKISGVLQNRGALGESTYFSLLFVGARSQEGGLYETWVPLLVKVTERDLDFPTRWSWALYLGVGFLLIGGLIFFYRQILIRKSL